MARLNIEVIPALSDNYVYLISESETDTVAVVDPAAADPVLAALDGRSLDQILITHHHFDHTDGLLALKERFGCSVVGPVGEKDKIAGLDSTVSGGDRHAVGSEVAEVIDTPGHTLGHISFWFPTSDALFCADALFSLGCGRVFEGTPEQMWQSLERLAALPDSARVYCGHEYTQSNAQFALTIDPDNEALRRRAAEIDEQRRNGQPTIPSLLGEEKAVNPFLRPANRAIRSLLEMEQASDAEVFAEIRRRKDES